MRFLMIDRICELVPGQSIRAEKTLSSGEELFRGWVRPDEVATIYAQISSSLEQIATAQCHVEVNGVKKCSAEIRASFVPRDQLGAGYRDEVLEEFLQRARSVAT